MTVRHAVLAAGAALMLGAGVYLLIEVRAQPAAAQVKPGKPGERGAVREPVGGAADEGGSDPAADERGAGDDPASRSAQARPSGSMTHERPKDPEAPAAEAQAPEAPHKVDALMAEANKAYDRGELDEAKAIAQKVLASTPNNVRMLRIVVSTACISGDNAEAQKAYLLLPKPDREQMKTRCARYGTTFTDE